MRRPLPWLVAIALVAIAGDRLDLLARLGTSESAGAGALVGRVVHVTDGDTVKVQLASGPETVRYIGVDTPESKKPGTPVQCYALRAAALNARLVAGRRVRLVPGAEARDRYGRLLAYVYRVGDGRFVNEALVRDGAARTLAIAPNTRFAARFSVLADQARARSRGLWGAC